jgi:phosphatidyl-myo-inositol dimannoside synthase
MHERMRCLILSTEFPPGPGGIGTHAHQLATELGNLGWDTAVASPQDYSDAAEIAGFNTAQPFPVLRLDRSAVPGATVLRRGLSVNRWIRSWKPDVLLASGMRMVWLAALLARLHRVPWVAVGHGTEFGIRRRRVRAMNRYAFGRADAVVCVSRFTWDAMSALGVRPRDGRVVHNGADAGFFRILPAEEVVRCRESLGVESGRLIVTVGNVTPRKGQDTIVRAMPYILERAADARYLAVGLPTYAEEFTQLARELGVADRVHFLGRVQSESLVGLLNAADVFAMTSRHTADGDFEGYGIAVIEAALCGKPAVVSRNSGLAEAVVDGVTGMEVGENDEIDTARAVADLLCDDERRRTMGEAARVRAATQQTWTHKAREYGEVLSNVVHGRSRNVASAPFVPAVASRSPTKP